MKPSRQHLLGGALVATLAATAWTALQPDEEAVVAPLNTRRAPPPRAGAASGAPAAPSQAIAPTASPTASPAARSVWAEPSAEQLAAWQPLPPPPPPPAPPPPPPAAPPPPVAPPLPYQMIGRLIEGEGGKAVEIAMLSSPGRSLNVRRGEVIDGQWRVDQIDSSGVRLTWLPGQLPQHIAFKAIP